VGARGKLRSYPSIVGFFETTPINRTFPRTYHYLVVAIHEERGASALLDVSCSCIVILPDTDSSFKYNFHFTLDALSILKYIFKLFQDVHWLDLNVN